MPTPISVASISPESIPAGSSAISVTITGSGFQPGTTVTFEAFPGATPTATVTSVTPIEITAEVSVGTNGPNKARVGDVRVTNPDGSTDCCVDCFTVTVGGASNAATTNVMTVLKLTDTAEARATTGDTSDLATTTDPLTDTYALAEQSDPTLRPADRGAAAADEFDAVDQAFADMGSDSLDVFANSLASALVA